MKKKTTKELEDQLVTSAVKLHEVSESASKAAKSLKDCSSVLNSYTDEQWENIRKNLGIISPSQAIIGNSDVLKKVDIAPPDSYAVQRVVDELGREARNAVLYGTFQWPKSSPVGYVTATVKAEDEEPEEWIWVEGYKGTDKDMKCRDFQFELGKEFYHEGDVGICRSGFHFCQKLNDVFTYYDVKGGNRFFKVRALVNKRIYKEGNSKDVAKIITFTEELSREEIFAAFVECHPEVKNMPAQDFDTLFNRSKYAAMDEWSIDVLVQDGYCPELAEYFVKNLGAFKVAHIFASQPGLSMDAKVIAITNIACSRR